MSAGRGAYCLSISTTACDSPVLWSSVTLTTWPTGTPEICTEACEASSTAWSNSTLKRYPCEASGSEPPNEIHRKMSSPMHEAVKATIVSIAKLEGRCLFMVTRGR